MLSYLVRRTANGILTLALLLTIVFVGGRVIGDPTSSLLPLDATEAQRDALRAQLGLDQPIWQQFLKYVGGVVTFDFGESYWQGVSAMRLVLASLPMTLALVVPAVVIAALLALTIGTATARVNIPFLTTTQEAVGLALVSIPKFWLGLMAIILFGVNLAWFPTSGSTSWRSAVLPIATLAVVMSGRFLLYLRRALDDELLNSYVEMGTTRGLSRTRVLVRHALPNVSIGYLSVVSLEAARTFAGYVLVVEVIFAWSGIGLLTKQALDHRDLPLMQACVLVVGVVIILFNLALDLVYQGIDPRIRVVSSRPKRGRGAA